MPIHAALQRLHLQSPQPEAMARFYARAYGLKVSPADGVFACSGHGRAVHVSAGEAHRLHHALYGFAGADHWEAFNRRTNGLQRTDTSRFADLPSGAIAFSDPDGNCMAFAYMPGHEASPPRVSLANQAGRDDKSGSMMLAAMNQHFAFRTTRIDEMLAFYEGELGFHLSDRVLDGEGKLRACFLRTDHLHHSLALFGAPLTCFDHQSFEAPSWDDLKQWADHMSRERIEIVWGVGRHGPGNDVFFMVRDPDGNLAEISAEIEQCAEGRPVGLWPHEERTLNLWGKAILRS